jgi:hypothetical protein
MPRSVAENVGFCGGFLYGIGMSPVEQFQLSVRDDGSLPASRSPGESFQSLAPNVGRKPNARGGQRRPEHVARFRDRYEHATYRTTFLTLTDASVYMNRHLRGVYGKNVRESN